MQSNEKNKLHAQPSQLLISLAPFHMIPEKEGSYILRGAAGVIKLTGSFLNELIADVFPLLDGSRTEQQIEAELAGRFADGKIAQILFSLNKHGLLEKTSAPPKDLPLNSFGYFASLRRYFKTDSQCGWDAIKELRQAHVVITGCNPLTEALICNLIFIGIGKISLFGESLISEQDVVRSHKLSSGDIGKKWVDVLHSLYPLARLGVSLEYLGEQPKERTAWDAMIPDANLIVSCIQGPSYFTHSLKSLNDVVLKREIPWTIVADIERVGFSVGPTMFTEETACLRCFEVRYKSNLKQIELFQKLEKHADESRAKVDFGNFTPHLNMAAAVAANEIVDVLVSSRLALSVGKMITLDLRNDYNIVSHNVLRVPTCDVCTKQAINRVQSWA